MGSSAIELREGYVPGAIGRIVELHGSYYAGVWGSGAAFESLVARELSDFVEQYDPAIDLLLTAHDVSAGGASTKHGRMVGGLAMLGRNDEPGAVRLRWFIVDPSFHGRGAGRALLDRALAWARERRFGKVILWTVDNLPASRAMYEKAGFRVAETHAGTEYSVPHHHVKMELPL